MDYVILGLVVLALVTFLYARFKGTSTASVTTVANSVSNTVVSTVTSDIKNEISKL